MHANAGWPDAIRIPRATAPPDARHRGSPQADTLTPDNPYAPYAGDWVGNGWSYETRFRQSRGTARPQAHGRKAHVDLKPERV